MAFGIGNLGQIVQDFTSALSQIFTGGSSNPGKISVIQSLAATSKIGGVVRFDASRWTGNAVKPKTVRYGFASISSRVITSGGNIPQNTTFLEGPTGSSAYYLDIPPQNIAQKENFATNIQATRKGIIVETEGVVFKDITISGTTGVFPDKRGGFNGPQSQIFAGGKLTDPPSEPAGVDPSTGLSKESTSKTVSGYAEFIGLRQFFLKYAKDKVDANGDLFMVFVNEKDNQALIVEPLEFLMERSSKRPMEYNYKITLKGIGDLGALFNNQSQNAVSFLEQVGNVAANVSAAVGQVRAGINATSTVFQKTFQALDATVNGPLLQVQMATQDLADGVATVMSLPSIFINNVNQATLSIRENFEKTKNLIQGANKSERTALASQLDTQQQQLALAENSNSVPVPRSFVASTRDTLKSKADNITDSLNLSDPLYNSIKGRTVTENPGPLKIASDDEFLLMGSVYAAANQMNFLLSSNNMFESDAEVAFENARKSFEDPTVPEANQFVQIAKPDRVREVYIKQNDTLERIAARELGDASQWPSLVVLNNLKPPYIDPNGGDGVRKPGERILVGVV